jgi:dienelactone hydrolase
MGRLMKSISFLLAIFAVSTGISGLAQPAVAQKSSPFSRVEFETLDKRLQITGYLVLAKPGQKTPAAVFSPACSGLMKSDGKAIKGWYQRMAKFLKQHGVSSLLVDGFTPRGESDICLQKADERMIDGKVRGRDSLAGLKYLRTRSEIDPNAIFLFSWGATGSFEVMEKGNGDAAEAGGGFNGSVMFYPECDSVYGSYSSGAPIQILVGDKDTWNPASECISLKKRVTVESAMVNLAVLKDALHGFDVPMAVQEVSMASGTHTVGENSKAREKAYMKIAAFIKQNVNGGNRSAVGGKDRGYSADEVKRLVSGNTLSFVLPSNGKSVRVFFAEDGRAFMKIVDNAKTFTQKWAVNEKGFLCRILKKQNKKHCTKVGSAGRENNLRLWNSKLKYEAEVTNGNTLTR